jgi:acetate kinase
MRDLLDRETQDVRAAQAVALLCYQVKKWIGTFAAALGGLEALMFAGASESMRPRSAPGFAMGWDSLGSKSKKSETRRMRA